MCFCSVVEWISSTINAIYSIHVWVIIQMEIIKVDVNIKCIYSFKNQWLCARHPHALCLLTSIPSTHFALAPDFDGLNELFMMSSIAYCDRRVLCFDKNWRLNFRVTQFRVIIVSRSQRKQFDTGGKPSTWFPPVGLVEHMFVTRA
jgi:hypothetical protein